MADLLSVESAVALLTLTALEVILGIDNVIFIAVLAGRLPSNVQDRARKVGISVAVVTRVLLLLSITWLMGLTRPLFGFLGHGVSGKDLILLIGGLFLIAKSTSEIHDKLEGAERGPAGAKPAAATFGGVVVQIMLLDVVFSLDSVITAVGMASRLSVMVVAVLVATMKMLALAFLILIGVTLVAESLGRPIEKGYIYFAMAFSFFVELLNTRLRRRAEPIRFRHSTLPK